MTEAETIRQIRRAWLRRPDNTPDLLDQGQCRVAVSQRDPALKEGAMRADAVARAVTFVRRELVWKIDGAVYAAYVIDGELDGIVLQVAGPINTRRLT